MAKKTRTRDHDSWLLEQLANDPEFADSYLDAAEADSTEMFLEALRNVLQARRQMSSVARQIGIARESLYRALSREGNPTAETLRNVLTALGITRHYVTERHKPATPPTNESTSTISHKVQLDSVQRESPNLGLTNLPIYAKALGTYKNANQISGTVRLSSWVAQIIPVNSEALGVVPPAIMYQAEQHPLSINSD